MHDMGSLGRMLQIDLPRELGEPSTAPGRVEGGGQPVLSFEQCLFYFVVFLCFLRSLLGA